METSKNNSFSLPSSRKNMFLRNALDSFAIITGIVLCYLVFIKDRPGFFYMAFFIAISAFYSVFKRIYLNRSVKFSDTGITLRSRVQKEKHYCWKQVKSIHYVNTDAGASKNFGRIDIHLKNSDVIELNLDEYCSMDYAVFFWGKYDPDIVSNLTEICNRNGKKFHLR